MTSSSTGQIADLDSTISALQGGLTSVPPEAAISNIESWQQQLQGTEIASALEQLKTALTSGNASGQSVGQLLAQLGKQTADSASGASGDAANKLQQLGQILTQAGSSLG
ncbi:MAG TPA: hypothetical protein V6D03_03335 [Candidatus Caenarcaniphilales bacterium]|jgi:ABC-type transporter Mla subunit MlaD